MSCHTSSGGDRTSIQPGHFQVTKVVRQSIRCKRQRSKGARSFRDQKIFKSGHRMHFFSQKKLTSTFFKSSPSNTQITRSDMVTIFVFCLQFTLLPKKSNMQGGARAVNLPAAKLFDLARPGVAPLLHTSEKILSLEKPG